MHSAPWTNTSHRRLVPAQIAAISSLESSRASTTASNAFTQIPANQELAVYFKGSFARRSGVVSSSPAQVYDVVDLDMVNRK